MIIAIDFDGTIAEHKYPDIGDPLPLAFEVMKELKDAGHVLVLNTCRENMEFGYGSRQYLSEAIDFCRSHGLEFNGWNHTPLEHDFRDLGGTKVYADLYIDDLNLGGFPGWAVVREEILG